MSASNCVIIIIIHLLTTHFVTIQVIFIINVCASIVANVYVVAIDAMITVLSLQHFIIHVGVVWNKTVRHIYIVAIVVMS